MKILVIEDDMITQKMMVRNLKKAIEGCEIDTAADGKSALDKITSGGYAVITVDQTLPDMNGTDILPKIKEAMPDCVTIGVSGDDGVFADSPCSLIWKKPIPGPDQMKSEIEGKL
eukprot:108506_1